MIFPIPRVALMSPENNRRGQNKMLHDALIRSKQGCSGKIGFRNHQKKINEGDGEQSSFLFSCATVCRETLARTGFGEKWGRRRKTRRIASSFSLFETGLSTPGNVRVFPAHGKSELHKHDKPGANTQLEPSSLSRQSRDGGVYIRRSRSREFSAT